MDYHLVRDKMNASQQGNVGGIMSAESLLVNFPRFVAFGHKLKLEQYRED